MVLSSLLSLGLMVATAPAAETAPTADQIRAAADRAPAPGYRMYALRIGVTAAAKRDLFIVDDTLPRRIEIAFAFWVLRGPDRVILIDAGFVDRAMVKQWRISDYREPTAALADLGLTAGEVTDVVITHRHWDHIGGLASFPGARLWMSPRDFKGTFAWAKKGDPALHGLLAGARADGRLRLTERIHRVAPSVVTVRGGLHTPGFQWVAVNGPDGWWVFASDIGPLRANFERKKPTGQSSDRKRGREVLETMLKLVGGDVARIIPGHEPDLFADGATIELGSATAGTP